jgi:DNA topoisomerase-3
MGKKLILAEKPSLGAEIATSLGIKSKNKNGFWENNDIIVASLVGHVLKAEYEKVPWTKDSLPLKGLEYPKMKPIYNGKKEDKRALVKKLLMEINRSDVDEIVSAGDADQEGSLLVYELLEYAKVLNKKKITRMWILALDKETISTAYNERFDIQKDLKYVEAAKSRGFADVTVGFNFSRLFSMMANMNGSVGRVRTAIMQIVKFRMDEIENFTPKPYFNVKGVFDNTVAGNLIMEAEDDSGKLKTTTAITPEFYSEFVDGKLNSGDKFTVTDVQSKNNSEYPDLLPNQNDVLKSVSKIYKVDAKLVERAMQFLYENKFISYPRSEKRHLKKSTFPIAKKIFDNLVELYSDNINGEKISISDSNKRIFDDAKVEEHFAVIPWLPKTMNNINSLDKVQRMTYDYIVAKFLMACMEPNKYMSSSIVLENSEKTLKFKATGKIVKSKGFKSYKYPTNNQSKDVVLPDVKEGDVTSLKEFTVNKKMTTPPALFTKPDILEIMENVTKLYKKLSHEEEELYDGKFALGTPATRIGILDSLFDKYKYLVFNKKKQITLSDDGVRLLSYVKDAISIQLTADFEADMKKIHDDISYSKVFNKKIEDYVHGVVKKLINTFEFKAPKHDEIDFSCPLCGAPLVETNKAYRCSKSGKWDAKKKKWSGCGFSILIHQKPLNKDLSLEELGKLLDGKTISNNENTKLSLDLKSSFFTKVDWGETGVSESGNSSSDDIIESPKFFKKGDVIIWKTISGKKISKDIAIKLFNGETVAVKGLKSKAGKKFDTNLVLENGKIVFKF